MSVLYDTKTCCGFCGVVIYWFQHQEWFCRKAGPASRGRDSHGGFSWAGCPGGCAPRRFGTKQKIPGTKAILMKDGLLRLNP